MIRVGLTGHFIPSLPFYLTVTSLYLCQTSQCVIAGIPVIRIAQISKQWDSLMEQTKFATDWHYALIEGKSCLAKNKKQQGNFQDKSESGKSLYD